MWAQDRALIAPDADRRLRARLACAPVHPMGLTTSDHDRGAAGLTYVYPVVSRRARGVSLGINLNPNQACNWRCVYCQVPGLVRGAGPAIDLGRLREELTSLLGDITDGDWMEAKVPAGSRRLNDVAFSGDGEPTTSPDFAAAIEVVAEVLAEFELAGKIPVVLITNGSQVHKPQVRAGLERLAAAGGEVWFKLDGGSVQARQRLNDTDSPDQRVEDNLIAAAEVCRVRLQTMALAMDGAAPSEEDQRAWIELVARVLARGAAIQDVLLYGLERESHQPEAARLSKLPAEWLEAFAARVQAELDLEVQVHP